jgi:transposase
MACILTLARFCAPSSELQIAEFWYGKTALDDLLGVAPEKVNEDRLYRALDALLPHKEDLFRHFQRVYGELFGTTFDLLLYDVTSTYFEGKMESNPQAKHGHSRDGRPDCVQLCIALVVTPEGLPLAYEVFDGNRTDVTTVEEILALMRDKYGHERRTWVMDRGMVSEDNLKLLRESGAKYLVGTPKSMLKDFEQQLLEEDWETVEPGIEVKLCPAPDGSQETFVLCRSQGRIEKERAMRERQRERLQTALIELKTQIDAEKRALRNQSRAERRVGRLFQKYSRAARFFQIDIQTVKDPAHKSKKRLTMCIASREENNEWAESL